MEHLLPEKKGLLREEPTIFHQFSEVKSTKPFQQIKYLSTAPTSTFTQNKTKGPTSPSYPRATISSTNLTISFPINLNFLVFLIFLIDMHKRNKPFSALAIASALLVVQLKLHLD